MYYKMDKVFYFSNVSVNIARSGIFFDKSKSTMKPVELEAVYRKIDRLS